MSIVKTVQIHRCDNCGKEEGWNSNWLHKYYYHTSGGPGPWDELVTVCSVECRDAYHVKRKDKKK